MALRVYNTLSQKKEPFETGEPGKVTMYVCGPTVYKPSHLGHMVGPVIFDTVKRYLVYNRYQVTLVVNITDVDDKLIIEANKQGISVADLAARVTEDYLQNLDRLHVTGIDDMPRATEHIDNIIDMIRGLIEHGYAYPAEGDVYFDVTKDDDYGKLCHRDPAQLKEGARIEVSERKRNPGDFALWKAAKPGEPKWDSPWGAGRPGWHIECSAMSMNLLGKTLDIHGGGLDLQFPHHENELAQSESYTGVPFVRYWMHNGLMRIHSQASKIKGDAPGEGHGPQKMSKSLGNEIVVSELLKRHQPETLRFFLLATHYRRPIDYSEERLLEIRKGLEGFYRLFERFERIAGASFYELHVPAHRGEFDTGGLDSEVLRETLRLREQFLEHMDDDFNTGGAIGVLYELLSALNRFADQHDLESSQADKQDVAAFRRALIALKEMSQILGVFLEPPEQKEDKQDELIPRLMQLLIDLRAEARKAKNFALGDQIRKRLVEIGITLEDRKEGTLWRRG
jgi:cysteinyl-tRNA synthetase